MLPIDAPKLFSYYASSCCWRVRIALRLKKIECEYIAVDIGSNKQLNDSYRQLNPIGQVPVLNIDGRTLIESFSIMHYLEESRPEHPLLPVDLYDRTVVRELCGIICSGIQPMHNVNTLLYVKGCQEEWLDFWITRGFNIVEKILVKSSGTYCVGDQITMADCCLLPQFHKALKFEIDLDPYPVITRIAEVLDGLPEFDETRPEKQPDFPPEVLI